MDRLAGIPESVNLGAVANRIKSYIVGHKIKFNVKFIVKYLVQPSLIVQKRIILQLAGKEWLCPNNTAFDIDVINGYIFCEHLDGLLQICIRNRYL